MQKIISNKTDSVFWIKDCEILRNTFIYVCTSIYREGKLEMHMPQAAIEGGGCNKSASSKKSRATIDLTSNALSKIFLLNSTWPLL